MINYPLNINLTYSYNSLNYYPTIRKVGEDKSIALTHYCYIPKA